MPTNFQLYGSGYDSLAQQQAGYSRTYDAASEGNRAAIMAARQFELQQQAQADAQADAYRERDIERGIRLSQYGDTQDYNNRTLESEDYLRRARAKAEGLKFAPSAQDFDNFMQSYKNLPRDANIGQLFPNLGGRDAARAKAVFDFEGTQRGEIERQNEERRTVNDKSNQAITVNNIVGNWQSMPPMSAQQIQARYGVTPSQAEIIALQVAENRRLAAEQMARQGNQNMQAGVFKMDEPSLLAGRTGTNLPSFKIPQDRLFDAYDPQYPGVQRDTNRFRFYAPDAPQTSTGTNSLAPNEVVKLLKNGQFAVFDSITKQFIRYAQ